MPEWEKKNQNVSYLVYFRKSFHVEELPESCRLRVSADTRYKLYVNGKLAELGPSRGDRLVWYCDEVEIAPFLTVEENVLAVEVLRYPLNHPFGNHGMF